jgi:rhodanese-related sulfurtransferase
MKMNITDKPQYQEFHLDGVKHIAPEETFFAVKNNRAILLDIREEYEWNEKIDLTEVLYHPMSLIMDRLKHITDNKTIIVACTKGERSTKIANLLIRQGFKSVANLDGGINEWKKQNLPMVSTGTASCGCGCSCH